MEFIQYLEFVGFGPSSNTCPKCAPHLLQLTSVRTIPCVVSEMYSILSSEIGFQKLGQPEPESNLAHFSLIFSNFLLFMKVRKSFMSHQNSVIYDKN